MTKKMILLAAAVGAAVMMTGCQSTPGQGRKWLLDDRDGSLPLPVDYVQPGRPAPEVTQPKLPPIQPKVEGIPAQKIGVAGKEAEAPVFLPVTPSGKAVAQEAPKLPELKRPAAPSGKQPTVASDGRTVKHIVAKGETLSGISKRYNVRIDNICRANGISDPTKIYAGKVLLIPNGVPGKPAEKKVAPVKKAEPSAKSAEGASTDKVTKGIYVVQNGDSLWVISRRLKISEKTLKELNPGLRPPYRLSIGQKLRVGESAALPLPSTSNAPKKAVAPEAVKPEAPAAPAAPAPAAVVPSPDQAPMEPPTVPVN